VIRKAAPTTASFIEKFQGNLLQLAEKKICKINKEGRKDRRFG